MLMTFLKKDHRGLALPDFKAYLKAHNNYNSLLSKKDKQIRTETHPKHIAKYVRKLNDKAGIV